MENATLSPLEQKIYFTAKSAKDNILFLDILRSMKITDNNTLKSTISRMVKKGWLLHLRNGVYLVREIEGLVIKDAFNLATYIFKGYIAFASALYIHKLVDTIPFEIQVATTKERGTKQIGQFTFRAYPIEKRHIGSERRGNYLVSSLAKTLYDALIYPDLSGGYTQIVRALYEARMSENDWKEFFYYADKFESNAFYQRLGYILELLPKKNKVIKKIIKMCLEKVKSKIYLFKRKKGKYISRWKLIDNMGKEKLLSWWY